MKKFISLLLAGIMVLSLAACGSGTEAEATTAETVPVETEEEETVSMANPMVEISDTEEFQKELGIYIDANLLYSDAKMFITDGNIAECQFEFEDIMGNPVTCTLRATKSEEAADNLHGVSAELTDESNETVKTADGDILITLKRTESGESYVYTWQIDDVWYSFVLTGLPSEMELADVKESVLNAIGVEPVAEETEVSSEEETKEYEVSADGTVLTVCFPANPTTGYEWSYKIKDESTLELVASEYQQTPGTEGLAGAGGTWTASFRSLSASENYVKNYVEFTYARNWEGGGMPDRVVDLNIVGQQIEIIGIHEPDFDAAETAPDGTYDVTLRFTDMIEENELSHYALIGIPVKIVIPDEDVQALKVGDVIQLADYGGEDYLVSVEKLEKTSDTRIVLSNFESISYDDDLGGWVVVGPDDDIYSYTGTTYKVHFTNETKINDGMEEVAKTGNTGTIYDKMSSYIFVDANVTVKDGWVSEITIHYHP